MCAALCALHKASVTTSDSSPGRSLAASERSCWQRSWLPGKVPSYRISGPARARCQSFVFREVVPCWLLEAPPGGSSAWWLPVNNQLVLDQLPARVPSNTWLNSAAQVSTISALTVHDTQHNGRAINSSSFGRITQGGEATSWS